MSTRWTREEEGKLLKLIASGKTCKELTGGFNRSENALELRLKKIIYDNIVYLIRRVKFAKIYYCFRWRG